MGLRKQRLKVFTSVGMSYISEIFFNSNLEVWKQECLKIRHTDTTWVIVNKQNNISTGFRRRMDAPSRVLDDSEHAFKVVIPNAFKTTFNFKPGIEK